MWKIGNIEIKNRFVLAPMAGISNSAYFKIVEEMGVGYVVTELISSEAIVRGNKKTFEMLNGLDDLDIPVAIQIFGSDPDVMSDAASILCDKFNAKIIDINMGCPVPKVAVKGDAGSALLKDISKIREIVSKVVSRVNVPVTVKIRSGWDNDNINAVSVAKAIEDSGAAAIAIHARTRSQGYSGVADWDIIKKVKENVSIPVIGNGDIKSALDAKKMLDDTNCDAFMIGRAALGNPWIFKECDLFFKYGIISEKPVFIDKIDMIIRHYLLLKKYNNEKKALLEIRTHALWYMRGIPNCKEYKTKITCCKTEKEFFSLLEQLKKDINSYC